MGRAINLDMYEGNAARRIPEGYGERSYYNRRSGTEGAGRESACRDGSRAAWKEPVCDDRGRSRASDGRATHEHRSKDRIADRSAAHTGGSGTAGRGAAYEGGSRSRTAGRRATYAGENRSRAARRESVYIGRSRGTAGGRKKSRRQNKKRLQRRILGGLCFYFLLAGIIATCWLLITLFFGKNEKVYAEEGQSADSGGILDETLAQEGVDVEEGTESGGVSLTEITPEIRRECQDMYARQESLLLLVNKEHELSASYQPVLRSICKGRLETADILYEDLCAMLEAGEQAGYQYWIASAYRDRAYQQGLVDEDVEKYMSKGYSYEAALQKTYEYTMPPGSSEHETGLALDILCSTNTIMDESQKGEPGNRWLVQHCHEYGFILRYPEDKEGITDIHYEPWHFRYVGKEAAAYLTQKGWTLEEFYQVLESDR